ncbi:type II toxin-antitoxin system VapB family antitoxin [Acidicapsa acidisoli]|uniref:type II toxin-antitoxin system VapB family antitoxin n=1 Tax=Acidicapsa acidisoli TaxID=1615681 RepID=UPI0021DF450C|nr:type II toxin-antitoxin system VapB family antitoxin [Acidicapsa acidisoli]
MTSLNIKNAETVRLVRELSQRTGQSMTGAITLAVKAQLAQDQPNPKAGLAKWLDEVTCETSAMMNDGRTSKELIDELYDPETGLPI